MQIKAKISLIFTGMVLVILLISSFFTLISIKSELEERLKLEIIAKSDEVKDIFRLLSVEKELGKKIKEPNFFEKHFREQEDSLFKDILFQLTNKNGQVITTSANLKGEILPVLETEKFFELKVFLPKKSETEIYYYCSEITEKDLFLAKLQIGIPKDKNNLILKRIFLYEIIEIIIGMIITVFLSMFLARAALRPLNEVLEKVKKIEINDLQEKITVEEKANDEIGQLVSEFNNLLEKVYSSVEAQNQFISDASHELRSPLTSIIGHSELLRKRGKNDPEVFDNSSASISKEAKRLIKMVNDLIYMARTEAKIFDLKDFNLVNTLKEIETNLLPLYERLSIKYENETIFVHGDEDALKRVFLNLINNALAATRDKGSVLVRLKATNSSAEIIVEDTGIGIPEEHLGKIFERFYKVDHSRKKKGEKSGLGLSITREIIKNHQGKIEVTSNLGEGSTFRVFIPKK